jgi:small-conductance mechanosensitive channel
MALNHTVIRVEDPLAWLNGLTAPQVALELGVIAGCVSLAWLLVWLVRRVSVRFELSILLGRRLIDGVLFPLLLMGLSFVARMVLAHLREAMLNPSAEAVLMDIWVPVCVSLACIRLGVKVLQVSFSQADWVRPIERTLSWLAWGGAVLWITGILPLVLDELDQIHWKIGNTLLSVRTLLEGGLTAGGVLILTLWLSSAIESRLLSGVSGSELSLRKAISNAVTALLMFIGVLMALSSVGIDLTALSVMGGAVGVGIGLGLQKLAANYVSGFVILAERSIRIGDNVRVDGFEGRITDIKARYTVIRSVTGRESIVPNEMLITQRVENLSLADTSLWQSAQVTVGYDSDVEQVLALLLEACTVQERVLSDPAPTVALSAFGADGLEFTLGYWIHEEEGGLLNLKSLIHLGILQRLRAHGIEIPFPQRVVRMVT